MHPLSGNSTQFAINTLEVCARQMEERILELNRMAASLTVTLGATREILESGISEDIIKASAILSHQMLNNKSSLNHPPNLAQPPLARDIRKISRFQLSTKLPLPKPLLSIPAAPAPPPPIPVPTPALVRVTLPTANQQQQQQQREKTSSSEVYVQDLFSGILPHSGETLSEEPKYQVKVEGFVKDYYKDRALPPFNVKIVHKGTETVATNVNCKFTLEVRGVNADKSDDGLINHSKCAFLIQSGICKIYHLRFRHISRNHGGRFFLIISFMENSTEIKMMQSSTVYIDEITMKSERSFGCDKKDMKLIKSSDSVEKLPGIGKQYASRLAEYHYGTVAQLAKISSSQADMKVIEALVDAIRKDRGIISEPILIKAITIAKEIVTREQDDVIMLE